MLQEGIEIHIFFPKYYNSYSYMFMVLIYSAYDNKKGLIYS